MTLIIRAHISLARWAAFEAQVQVSARNNHESHGSRFTREPLIGQTNVGDEWPEEAPVQQQNTPTLLRIEQVQ